MSLIDIEKLPPVLRKLKALLSAMETRLGVVESGLTLETTSWVDGTDGTGVVQLSFLDADGNALTEPVSGFFYSSQDAGGLAATALTTGAAASKGVIAPILSGTTSHYHFITNATGELDLTLTAAAGDWYLVFKDGEGRLKLTDVLAITGP